MTAHRRELALQTLEQLCKATEDPIEQRRTATRLLAATRPRMETAPTITQRDSSPPVSTHFPMIFPNPARGPQATLRTMLEAIATKSQNTEHARATLESHTHKGALINDIQRHEGRSDFQNQMQHAPALAPLHVFDRGMTFELNAPTTDTKTKFEQSATITNKNTTHHFIFTLQPHEQAWLITKIQLPP